MKLDEDYFADMVNKICLAFDSNRPIGSFLKLIAADARREHNEKVVNVLSEIISDKDLLYTIKVVRTALDRAKGE